MKKIGEGYYYNVYEINKDKVLKKKKRKIRMFLFILISNFFNLKNTKKEYFGAVANIKTFPNKYQKILDLVKDKSIIANPEIVNETDCLQDKIKILNNLFKYRDQDFEKIVLDFTNLIQILWSYHLSDSVLKLRNNYGYDKNHKLVLVDFNEITFEKEQVVEDTKNKIWLEKTSYKVLPKSKKEIFVRIMDQEINLENLNKYWKDNN